MATKRKTKDGVRVLHSMFHMSMRLAKALETNAAEHRRLSRLEKRTPQEQRAYQRAGTFLTQMLTRFEATTVYKDSARARHDETIADSYAMALALMQRCGRRARELRADEQMLDDAELVTRVLAAEQDGSNPLAWEEGWMAAESALLAFVGADCEGKFDAEGAAKTILVACPPPTAHNVSKKSIERSVTAARQRAKARA